MRPLLKISLLVGGAAIATSSFAQVQTQCRPNTLGTGLNCTSNLPRQQSEWQTTIDLVRQVRRDKEARAREKELDEKIREGRQKLEELNQQAERARIQYEQVLAREAAEREALSELNRQVSTAVLEHRCEDAKTIALSAGQLAMAERAMRLCTPPPEKPSPPKSGATNRLKASPAPAKPALSKASQPADHSATDAGQFISSKSVNNLPKPSTPSRVIARGGATIEDYMSGRYATLPDKVLQLAKQGYYRPQYEMYQRYFAGLGVAEDKAEAINWLKQAAEQNLPEAQNSMGDLFYEGTIVGKNYEIAADWYLKAAEKGLAPARARLGLIYAYGLTGKPNYHQAASLLRQAADANLAIGHFGLGLLYQNGAGVPKDTTEALRRFKLAGNPEGLYQIGLIYELGLSVEPNRQTAIYYYRLAAENGNGPAQQILRLLEVDTAENGSEFSELGNLKPIKASSLWVTASDYPFLALSNGITGSTMIELSVSANGDVLKCENVSKSGNAELDQRACLLMQSRARFHPLKPTEDKNWPLLYLHRLTWALGK